MLLNVSLKSTFHGPTHIENKHVNNVCICGNDLSHTLVCLIVSTVKCFGREKLRPGLLRRIKGHSEACSLNICWSLAAKTLKHFHFLSTHTFQKYFKSLESASSFRRISLNICKEKKRGQRQSIGLQTDTNIHEGIHHVLKSIWSAWSKIITSRHTEAPRCGVLSEAFSVVWVAMLSLNCWMSRCWV